MASFTSQVAVGDKATAAGINNLIGNESITDSGSTSITPSGINVATTQAITFNKTFPTAPKVFLQVLTGVSGTGTVFMWATGITTTGFTANINRSNTTATAYAWVAVLTQ